MNQDLMHRNPLRQKMYEVIFGTETPAGKRFDVILIYVIILSVFALMLDSVGGISSVFGFEIRLAEWIFTLIFTVEYAARIYCAPQPWRYIRSFYGIIDAIAVLPTYISFFFPGINYLLVIRLFRVLRIFRVLKLMRYLSEANLLMRSMSNARRKIFVFFSFVLIISMVFGSIMYVVEGPENEFTSIPRSIYWMIVTITTVGYGDIIPQTILGQIVASAAMLTGYSIIAVPTGILTAELSQEIQRERASAICNACQKSGHEMDASYCKYCGEKL